MKDEIKKMHEDGKTMKEMAETGIASYAKVRKCHIELNLTPNSKAKKFRDEIIKLVQENQKNISYEDIAEKFKYTRQNISLICRNAGIRRRNKVPKSKKPKKQSKES